MRILKCSVYAELCGYEEEDGKHAPHVSRAGVHTQPTYKHAEEPSAHASRQSTGLHWCQEHFERTSM